MTVEESLSQLAFERLGQECDLFALGHLGELIRTPDDVDRLEEAVILLAVKGYVSGIGSGPHVGNRPSDITSGFRPPGSTLLHAHWDSKTLKQLCSVVPQTAKVKSSEVAKEGSHPVVDQGKEFIAGYVTDVEPIHVSEPLVIFGDHTREVKLVDFDFVVGADGVKLLKPVGITAKWLYYLLRAFRPISRGYGRHFHLLKDTHLPVPSPEDEGMILEFLREYEALARSLRDQLRA